MADLISINVKLRWDPARKAEEVHPATVATLRSIGEWWHSERAPVHFTPAAMALYNYQPRTRLYQIRKAKTKGHQNPLEWSGRFKASALAAKTMKISGQGKVRMRLSVWGGWETSRVHVRSEFFRTNVPEQAQIMMMLRTGLLQFLYTREGGMTRPGGNVTRASIANWAAERGIA